MTFLFLFGWKGEMSASWIKKKKLELQCTAAGGKEEIALLRKHGFNENASKLRSAGGAIVHLTVEDIQSLTRETVNQLKIKHLATWNLEQLTAVEDKFNQIVLHSLQERWIRSDPETLILPPVMLATLGGSQLGKLPANRIRLVLPFLPAEQAPHLDISLLQAEDIVLFSTDQLRALRAPQLRSLKWEVFREAVPRLAHSQINWYLRRLTDHGCTALYDILSEEQKKLVFGCYYGATLHDPTEPIVSIEKNGGVFGTNRLRFFLVMTKHRETEPPNSNLGLIFSKGMDNKQRATLAEYLTDAHIATTIDGMVNGTIDYHSVCPDDAFSLYRDWCKYTSSENGNAVLALLPLTARSYIQAREIERLRDVVKVLRDSLSAEKAANSRVKASSSSLAGYMPTSGSGYYGGGGGGGGGSSYRRSSSGSGTAFAGGALLGAALMM